MEASAKSAATSPPIISGAAMNDQQILEDIAGLSREFGSDAYVRGGGGNTSVKTDRLIYIKPSGIALADMMPGAFLPLDRAKLASLPNATFPSETNARERAVAAFMADAVKPGFTGRASVEAPLHDSFPQRFVVHTHPSIVNAICCSKNGAEAAARFVPEALWIKPIEPGYLLSVHVREALAKYKEQFSRDAEMVFLANHGIFIAHDEVEGIRRLYGDLMDKVAEAIGMAGFGGEPERAPAPTPQTAAAVAAVFQGTAGEDSAHYAVWGSFSIPGGPLSPDHIVYCKAHLYQGPAEPAAIKAFQARYGYWPKVAATPEGVFGFGVSRKAAALALEFAWDGALVERYAGAFGGVVYLEPRLADFIENWEVENYRRKVAT